MPLLIDWRQNVIEASHYLPLSILFFELFMNKLRFPVFHVCYTFGFTCLYFLITYIGQIINDDIGIYHTNLNWNCLKSFSFLVSITGVVDILPDKLCH